MGVVMYLIFSKVWQPSTKNRFILLVSVFLTYLLVGGLIFSLLNYPQEKLEISQMLEFHNEFYQNHTCVNRQELENLLKFSLKLSNNGIYYYAIANNYTNSNYNPEWKFGGNTIFFTYTLLATIGYGHLVPYTNYGKLFCIFYIIIGVPLTLLLLSIVTDYLTDLIEDKLFLKNNTNSLESINNDSKQESNKETEKTVASWLQDSNLIILIKYSVIFLIFLILIYIVPAYILSKYTESNWTFLEAFYFCLISLTTIGLGDYVPGNSPSRSQRDYYRVAITFYLMIGIISTTIIVKLLITIMPSFRLISSLFSLRYLHHDTLVPDNISIASGRY